MLRGEIARLPEAINADVLAFFRAKLGDKWDAILGGGAAALALRARLGKHLPQPQQQLVAALLAIA